MVVAEVQTCHVIGEQIDMAVAAQSFGDRRLPDSTWSDAHERRATPRHRGGVERRLSSNGAREREGRPTTNLLDGVGGCSGGRGDLLELPVSGCANRQHSGPFGHVILPNASPPKAGAGTVDDDPPDRWR